MKSTRQTPPTELQTIILEALINGAVFGIFCYLFFWLSLSLWTGLNSSHPEFFITHAIIFIVEAIATYLLIRIHRATPKQYLKLKQNYLIISTLLSALHWGIVTAWLVHYCDLNIEQQFMVQLIIPGFATIGGLILGIVNNVGFYYSALTLLPHVFFSNALNAPNASYLSFASLSLIGLIYVTNRMIQYNYVRFIHTYQHTKMYADSMETLSKTDYLTKLNNRFSFHLAYLDLWYQSVYAKSPLSLCYIEMGSLSDVQNRYGNRVGEQCIVEFAQRLKNAVAAPNLVACYETGKFIIALPNTNNDSAMAFSKTLINTINQTELIKGKPETKLNTFIGVASLTPSNDDNSEQLIEAVIKSVTAQKPQQLAPQDLH